MSIKEVVLVLLILFSISNAKINLDIREIETDKIPNLTSLKQFKTIRGVWLTNTDGNYQT